MVVGEGVERICYPGRWGRMYVIFVIGPYSIIRTSLKLEMVDVIRGEVTAYCNGNAYKTRDDFERSRPLVFKNTEENIYGTLEFLDGAKGDITFITADEFAVIHAEYLIEEGS